MIIRSTDSDGDWVYGKGKNDYLTNLDAVKKNIETRLYSWKGNCFFATAEGVDYNSYLDIGTKDFLDRDIKRILLQSEGVLIIKEFASNISSDGLRVYTATTTITTTFGNTTVNI